jgi:hypothetical protein
MTSKFNAKYMNKLDGIKLRKNIRPSTPSQSVATLLYSIFTETQAATIKQELPATLDDALTKYDLRT